MQVNLYGFLLGVSVALVASAGITLDAKARTDNMAGRFLEEVKGKSRQ